MSFTFLLPILREDNTYAIQVPLTDAKNTSLSYWRAWLREIGKKTSMHLGFVNGIQEGELKKGTKWYAAGFGGKEIMV